MIKKLAATLSAVIALGVALVVGVPIASAHEGGGQCNNYGNQNIIVAPNCGAQTAPTSAAPSTVTRTTTVTSTPSDRLCPQIYPQTTPGCPGYIGGPGGGGLIPLGVQ